MASQILDGLQHLSPVRLTEQWRNSHVKRFTILALTATAVMAQVPATAAPAPVAAPVAYAPVATAAEEAPLAPISMQLLQNHPGAPTGVEDVLLVPSANAGQKAVAFEWSGANDAQAYVLWKNYFAAAQYTGAAAATDAQTIASFGLMNPAWGAGVSLAYRDSTREDAASNQQTTYRALSQAKLFGSMAWDGKDVYGALLWQKPTDNVVTTPANGSANTDPRTDLVLLDAGVRKYPAAGVEGSAWNGLVTLGYAYDRPAGEKNPMIWVANLDGQYGYVLITDGINFLPGIDAYVHYTNGFADPDYRSAFGVSPYAALILPLYEHWTLKGGARYAVEQTLNDVQQGKPSTFEDHGLITNTTGNVGLRYTRNRWAVEAQIGNGLLTHGPYLISGGAGTGDLFASLALTVNLK
jgi:hypothetical protein